MTLKSMVMQFGSGTDLRGGDYTKAAKRAVQDALHHSSLVLFRTLEIDPNNMQIELTLAAQEPEKVDTRAVAATLPYGTVSVKAVKGGLNVPDDATGGVTVIVNAGILVRLPI